MDYINNLLHDLLDPTRRQGSFPTREWRGIFHYFVFVDAVPDGQQHPVLAAHLALNEPVQLVLWPLLCEERFAQHDHAEPRLPQSLVNRLTDAVSEF